jgi:hypothetical protein
MDKKDDGGDILDLEREIDSAVDTLLVEKEARLHPSPSPPKNQAPVKGATITEKVPAPSSKKILSPVKEATIKDKPSPLPPSTSQLPVRDQVPPQLKEKLEEVEAQLLTLEWDISSKHLNNAITHLQELRKLSHVGEELEKIIILIQKVLHQLIMDESKLTPSALKFLQKSWKAVKGLTDERFSFEIDKKTLVLELMAEFQKLRIEGAPKEVLEERETEQPLGGRLARFEERLAQRPSVEEKISFSDLDKFMERIENLVRIVNEERKRWESIHQEISNLKAEMQRTLSSGENVKGESVEAEIADLAERSKRVASLPSGHELSQTAQRPTVAVSLVNVSGITFGILETQLIRIFPIKRWVSDFFIERGKVKLKSREIPLFNIVQVFKLKTSTEENPQVILLRGKEGRPAAIIVDQAVSREEIEYQPIEGRSYVLGQGMSKSGRVWILDAEQISP